MRNKEKRIIVTLSVFCLLWIIVITPQGALFGSTTDWFSQHIQISDQLRSLIYDKQTLFPDFLPSLGGGQNVYAFSYYGLFRLDILLSLLLPFIAMKDIIIAYMVISIIASVDLTYIWLRKHSFSISISIFCSLLLLFSSLLFQAHRQIMFVNYMPYLLLGFLAIDYFFKKNKTLPLSLCIIMIITHSYFFSISSIVVLFIYFSYQCYQKEIPLFSRNGKKALLSCFKAVSIAIMICAVLLLPSALVMLEHTKSVATTSFIDIIKPDFTMNGLLYDTYGCGLTSISWIFLCIALFHKKTRVISMTLLCFFFLPIFAYLLNGTLYVRYKIFIPFLPLIIFVMAQILREWKAGTIHLPKIFPLFFILTIILGYKQPWIIFDISLCILVLILYRWRQHSILLILLLFMPICVSYKNNKTEHFVSNKNNDTIQSIQDNKMLENLVTENSRFDDLRSPLSTSNQDVFSLQKTSMYTSITNTIYNNFFYDTMRNAIPIRNRVACLSQPNPFFQGLMNVQYLYSDKEIIPIGYQTIWQKKKLKLLENKDVLPMAYTTTDLINQKDFDSIAYPYTLDTIYNNTVVDKKIKNQYQSKMVKRDLELNIENQNDNLKMQKKKENIYIQSKGKSDITLVTKQNISEEIILINFDIKDISNHKTKDTTISINGIKNKLSSAKANYPNGNTSFTYIVSNNKDWNTFKIHFSDGRYTLSNINVYSIPYDALTQRKVEPLQQNQTKGNEVLKGRVNTLEENAYFVTSLPYQKGYSAYIDGKETKIEIVNKAFVGFPIKSGTHEIRIEFNAPGKKISIFISLLGIGCLLINTLYERKKVEHVKK